MARELVNPFSFDATGAPRPCRVPGVSGGNSLSEEASPTRQMTTAIVRGDEEAFSEFYDLYTGRVLGLLLVMSGGNEEIARETHQRVMIKVARQFRVFDTDGQLWAWLARIARNALIDHARRRARSREDTMGVLPWIEETPGCDDHLRQWLEEALEQLDPEERSLIEQVYFDGRPQKEIANAQGHTVKAIESRLSRIRAKIRAFISRRTRHEH